MSNVASVLFATSLYIGVCIIMLDDNIYIYAILGLNGSLPFYTIRLLKCVLCCVSDMKGRSTEYLVISLLVKTSMISHMVYYANYHHTIYHANYRSSVA